MVELILGALDGEDRKSAAKRVSEYASLPGAAIPPGIAAAITGEPFLRRAPRLDAPPAQPTTARCEEGGGWDVDAPPTVKERRECDTEMRARSVGEVWRPRHCSWPICGVRRCEIDQRSRLTADEYKREYYDRGRAVLIRDVMSLEQRCTPPHTHLHPSTRDIPHTESWELRGRHRLTSRASQVRIRQSRPTAAGAARRVAQAAKLRPHGLPVAHRAACVRLIHFCGAQFAPALRRR